MDWNWFFSSFCQSAAALIGIIGAFVISRLLGINDRLNNIISDFDNLIIEFNETILKINSRHFYWFTKTHVKYNSDLKEMIEKGELNDLADEEILATIYSMDDRLFKIDEAVLESFKYLYEKHRPKYTDFGNGLSLKSNFPIIDIHPKNLWSDLEQEKELIKQLEINSHILIQKFTKNYQDLISFESLLKSLKYIIIVLLIAFPLTVIYPLHFLPIPINKEPQITINILEILASFSIKSLLLLFFLVIIEGLFMYFLIMIKDIKKELEEVKSLNSKELKDIKRYSVYFK
jgi:hypothetical protein